MIAPQAEQAQVLGCVPGRWGMIAVTAETPLAAVHRATALVATLHTEALAESGT